VKLGNKTLKLKTNISKEKCPVCGKNLRFKAACCGQAEDYLECLCGYDNKPSVISDEYERPKCKKCGATLFWEGSCSACKGKKNQWVCKKCGFKHITKDTLEKAISKLKKR